MSRGLCFVRLVALRSNAMAHNVTVPEPKDADDGTTEAVVPITSRFLFVDVAAQRAKQLRRGALMRLDRHAGSHTPHKLERIAMEEVRTGLVHYTLPTHIPPPEK
jgi:DNA-directed RNA polymerase omega subunit